VYTEYISNLITSHGWFTNFRWLISA